MKYVYLKLLYWRLTDRSLTNHQTDVSPTLIMKKVNDASGAKYSFHKEAPKRPDQIAPVGSTYKPVGAPDISGLRKNAKPDVIGKVVSQVCLNRSTVSYHNDL